MTIRTVSPGRRADYLWAWRDNSRGTPWLETGETVVDYTLTSDGGLVVASHQLVNDNSDVLAWLEFPDVLGRRCWADCWVKTSTGREETRRYDFLIGVLRED